MIKRILIVLIAFISATFVTVAQVSAASPVSIGIVAGYTKGNNTYDVVVKDAPGTKLVMYVNDKNPARATVNSKDWATFHKVKFANTGKISFTKQLQSSNNKTYERIINYVRYYEVANGKLVFLASNPSAVTTLPTVTVTPPPVVTPTPSPVIAPAPICTNGTYVNSAGNTVCSPEAGPSAPAGVTAQCVDGTYSFSQSRSGTCSHHGGVSVWL